MPHKNPFYKVTRNCNEGRLFFLRGTENPFFRERAKKNTFNGSFFPEKMWGCVGFMIAY